MEDLRFHSSDTIPAPWNIFDYVYDSQSAQNGAITRAIKLNSALPVDHLQ